MNRPGDVRGWLTVCASCKRIEVVASSWMAPEIFLLDQAHARVDHGLCSGCASALAREPRDAGSRPAGKLFVCSACKKVRDGAEDWTPLAAFLGARLGMRVIHGICPPCLEEL